MSKFRRWVALCLVLLSILPLFSSYSHIYADDSNGLRSSYINMANKKNISDLDVDTITPDSLRIIALYLSNFYTPLSTSLDGKDVHETKKTMIKLLQKSCNFDNKTASTLVNLVYKYSLSTAKPLWASADPTTMEKVSENIFSDTSEDVDEKLLELWNKEQDGITKYADGKYRGTYGIWMGGAGAYNTVSNDDNHTDGIVKFYWDENNKDGSVVFDTGKACTLAFMNGVEGRNPLHGEVFTLFNRKIGKLKTITKDDALRVFSINSTLYVDWVGNIIMDDGTERVIILPACSNPYALSKISDKGKGDRTPVNNLLGMYRVKKGKLVSNDGSDDNCNLYVNADNNSSLFDLDLWRIARNSDKTGLSAAGVSEGLKKALDQLGIERRFCFVDVGCSSRMWDDVILGSENPEDEDEQAFLGDGQKVLSTSLVVDKIQEYDNSGTGLERWFKKYSIFDKTKGAVSTKFSTGSKTKMGDMVNAIASADSTKLLGIYCSYIFAYTNSDATTFIPSEHVIDMAFDKSRFPTTPDESLNFEDVEVDQSQVDAEIKGFLYWLLHPTEGLEFVKTWAKNKISSLFIGWHEDMVGATDSNAATGITKYIGFTGYTTLPSLHDLSWTDWLLQNYNSIIVYLILIMSAIMCCYVIIGSITAQKAIISMFLFSLLAFLPPVAINSAVNIVNTSGDMIYGEKFTYWALVQHQTYLQDLYKATSGTEKEYTDFVLNQQSEGKGEGSSSAGFTTVKLKWMSPKKDNYMAGVGDALNKNSKDYDSTRDQLLKPLLSDTISGEEFLSNPDSLYLYRDYMDVTMYSLKSYNLYSEYYGGSNPDGSNTVSKDSGDYMLQVGYWWQGDKKNKDLAYSSGRKISDMIYANYEKGNFASNDSKKKVYKDISSVNAIKYGFLYNTFGEGTSLSKRLNYYDINQMSVNYLLNFTSAYSDIFQSQQKLDNLLKKAKGKPREVYTDSKIKSYGIDQPNFNFSMSSLSRDKSDAYSKEALDYFYYGLYSESPFYFFSYNLLDQLNTSTDYIFSLNKEGGGADGKGYFKQLLLQDNGGYFYNNYDSAGDGYGDLRDFMNMHDFFYYVLPLMKTGNDNVRKFDELYGMRQYDDVRVSFSTTGDVLATDSEGQHVITDIEGVTGSIIPVSNNKGKTWKEVSKEWSEEKKYKFWYNYNVAVMFNMYSTWADTMWDCNYAESETINVAGEKYIVEFPLDPTSYFKVNEKTGEMTEGRPMIFSRSEMKFYGLQWNDLTTVEQKILNVQDAIYEKSIDLMNYYNFDDDVLLSAMAMMELFEFNKEFSQKAVIGQDYILYPQGYELKAFSYDAYLRLILTNTTGEDLQNDKNKSIYQRVIDNTSISFGIVLIVLDIIAIYIIPAFRLFFLIILFFLSVLVIVSSAIKIELNIVKAVWKSLLAPLLAFSAVSIGLAFAVSLFMYDGNKGVTGSLRPSIVLGDPTMVCIVMVVVNAVVMYLYFKICKRTFQDFITFAKAVGASIAGAIGGTFAKLAGTATSGKTKYGLGEVGGVSRSPASRGGLTMPRPRGGINGGTSDSNSPSSGPGSGSGSGGGLATAGAVGGLAAASASQLKAKQTGDNNNGYGSKKHSEPSKYGTKISKGEKKIEDIGKKNKELHDKKKVADLKLQNIKDRRQAVKNMRKSGDIGKLNATFQTARLNAQSLRYKTKSVKAGAKAGLSDIKNETIGSTGRKFYANKQRTRLEINREARRVREQREGKSQAKLTREANLARRNVSNRAKGGSRKGKKRNKGNKRNKR